MSKKKLLTKHLAAYLPYRIDVFHKKQMLVSKIEKLSNYGFVDLEKPTSQSLQNLQFSWLSVSDLQPVLYPIESVLKNNSLALWVYESEPESFDNLEGAKTWLEIMITDDATNLPYKIIDKLCSMHVDAFGLLPNGLAREKRNDGN